MLLCLQDPLPMLKIVFTAENCYKYIWTITKSDWNINILPKTLKTIIFYDVLWTNKQCNLNRIILDFLQRYSMWCSLEFCTKLC